MRHLIFFGQAMSAFKIHRSAPMPFCMKAASKLLLPPFTLYKFAKLQIYLRISNSYLETIYNACIIQYHVHPIYQSQPSKKGKYNRQRKPPPCDNGYASKPCSKFILRHFFTRTENSWAFTLSEAYNRACKEGGSGSKSSKNHLKF